MKGFSTPSWVLARCVHWISTQRSRRSSLYPANPHRPQTAACSCHPTLIVSTKRTCVPHDQLRVARQNRVQQELTSAAPTRRAPRPRNEPLPTGIPVCSQPDPGHEGPAAIPNQRCGVARLPWPDQQAVLKTSNEDQRARCGYIAA